MKAPVWKVYLRSSVRFGVSVTILMKNQNPGKGSQSRWLAA
jgi:hypothetical protein